MTPSVTNIDFRRGFAALRALLANPDDLPQVFTVIECFSAGTVVRIAKRLNRSVSGRRLLAQRPDVVPILADRAALAALPAGSLGRAYLAFVESENITAEGIREAARQGHSRELDAPYDFVHARMRDTHDLWHAATGYRGDVLGELALLAFILAQIKNPAMAFMVAAGLIKTFRFGAPEARHVIFDGFRRGRRAAWLPEQEWESLLALPVEEVRERLSLEAPPKYTPVRSTELRTRQFAAA